MRGRIKNSRVDRNVFSRTARKTKTVNINPKISRGGIRF